jgi:hypothetical protein
MLDQLARITMHSNFLTCLALAFSTFSACAALATTSGSIDAVDEGKLLIYAYPIISPERQSGDILQIPDVLQPFPEA